MVKPSWFVHGAAGAQKPVLSLSPSLSQNIPLGDEHVLLLHLHAIPGFSIAPF